MEGDFRQSKTKALLKRFLPKHSPPATPLEENKTKINGNYLSHLRNSFFLSASNWQSSNMASSTTSFSQSERIQTPGSQGLSYFVSPLNPNIPASPALSASSLYSSSSSIYSVDDDSSDDAHRYVMIPFDLECFLEPGFKKGA